MCTLEMFRLEQMLISTISVSLKSKISIITRLLDIYRIIIRRMQLQLCLHHSKTNINISIIGVEKETQSYFKNKHKQL